MPIWEHVLRLILGTRETRYYYSYAIEIGLFPCTLPTPSLSLHAHPLLYYYYFRWCIRNFIVVHCIVSVSHCISFAICICTLQLLKQQEMRERERESGVCERKVQTNVHTEQILTTLLFTFKYISFEHLRNGNFREMRERCGVFTSALTLFPKHFVFLSIRLLRESVCVLYFSSFYFAAIASYLFIFSI